MIWDLKYPSVDLGLIPDFIFEWDERSAAEQINERYAHGGGWRPMTSGKWSLSDRFGSSPGELIWTDGTNNESYEIVAYSRLRDELILVATRAIYCGAWVGIIQVGQGPAEENDTLQVSRID
jgi:hypothetical protein